LVVGEVVDVPCSALAPVEVLGVDGCLAALPAFVLERPQTIALGDAQQILL
jgi:hypothetical protein